MASPTEENYLKALFSLTNEKEEANISQLSSLLHVSLPTVNSMIKNLKKQGLVNYEKYKPLSLTKEGKKTASLVVRKHRLTEIYLVEKMGFGWEEVHEIAELMEHIDSPVLFERMEKLLNFPAIDPHGSPIPDKYGRITHKSYKRLSNCIPGDSVRITALSHDSSEFLRFLNTRKLTLGTILDIQSVEPYDSSMIVSYKDHPRETFSQVVCDRLLVEQV